MKGLSEHATGYSVCHISLMFLLRIDLMDLQDFGVWNISYQSVSCESWSGFKDAAALGSVPSLGDDACCPADPTVNGHGSTCFFPPFDSDAGKRERYMSFVFR